MPVDEVAQSSPRAPSAGAPVRLCFLSPVGQIGGAERVLVLAARAMRACRPSWCLSAILFESGPLEGALAELGVTVRVLPWPAALASFGDSALIGAGVIGRLRGMTRLAGLAPAVWSVRRALARELDRLSPTRIHSNGLKSHLLAGLVSDRSIPVTWHLHDFLSTRPLMRRLAGWIASRSAGGIAISEAVARDWRGALPGLRVRTVLNAIDVDRFAEAPEPPPRASLADLAGLPPSEPAAVAIGLIATYATWKGHEIFLEALARVAARQPSVRGYVIGGPIYASRGSQVSAADLNGRIRALGLEGRAGLVPFQTQPELVHRQLDLVVHASTRPEPFGLTIAEAMAAGRGVVFARGGGADEVCRDGLEGLGHEPGDVASLAEAMERMVVDPTLRRQLGEAARAAARERFRVDRFGAELAAALEDG